VLFYYFLFSVLSYLFSAFYYHLLAVQQLKHSSQLMLVMRRCEDQVWNTRPSPIIRGLEARAFTTPLIAYELLLLPPLRIWILDLLFVIRPGGIANFILPSWHGFS
jgi:hypothetical protein